jgi:tRNA (mo5U34)-methyltransferase
MFHKYQHLLPYAELIACIESERERHFSDPRWDNIKELLEAFPAPDPSTVTLSPGPAPTFHASAALESELIEMIGPLLSALSPWKKGPFRIFGIDLDAEWRSDQKWERLCEALPTVRAKRVLDIGGNNGYYLYRMIDQDPVLLLCLDPSARCYFQFQFLQLLKPIPQMHFEPLGIEHLAFFPSFFDTILCMGVLYHRRDPLGAMQQLVTSLKPGGQCLLETLYIEGDEPICLCPRGRYACMPNVWFLPTVSTLMYWMESAGLQELTVVSTSLTGLDEQRVTVFSPGQSLSDFLSPSDTALTVEGYPRPRRVIISGWRKK